MENKETYGIILAAIDREPLWMSLWANFCTEGIFDQKPAFGCNRSHNAC